MRQLYFWLVHSLIKLVNLLREENLVEQFVYVASLCC